MNTKALIKQGMRLAVLLCGLMSLSSYAYHGYYHHGYYGSHYYRTYYGPRYHDGYYGPHYYRGYYSSYSRSPRYYYGPRYHHAVRVCNNGYCFFSRY